MKKHCALYGIAAILGNQAIPTAAIAVEQDAIIRRLDALEKENAALKQRLNKVEHSAPPSKVVHFEKNFGVRGPNGTLGRNLDRDLDVTSDKGQTLSVFSQENPNSAAYQNRHFELSGSLLILQPSTGNLNFGTAASPYPVPTPNWNEQTISPHYQPTFNIGLRYMPNEANDIGVNWTHLNTSTAANVSVNPVTQFIGPPFYVGPQGGNYATGQGSATFSYDSVHVEGGHTFCVDCSFQFRPFGGVEFANISNNLTGTFSNALGAQTHTAGLNSISSTTSSHFSGVGPRAGIHATYNWNDIQLISKFGGGLLIGTQQSALNTVTNCSDGCPGNAQLIGNYQRWASPGSTQVIPTIDAKLAAAYTFAPTSYGQFKVEAGYQAAVYFSAMSQYHLTNVPPALETQTPTGIYLATGTRTLNNFSVQGPYVTAKWAY